MFRAVTLFLVVAVMVGHAQTAPPPTPSSLSQAVAIEHPMSAAYAEGTLPRPLSIPEGTPDEVAPAIARKIAAKGPEGTPALVTALLTAGFGIRGFQGPADTTVIQIVRPGQGLVLDAWEIALMARAFDRGGSMPLSALAASLNKLPILQPVSIAPAVIASLRVASASTSPPKRFLARLIIELGRYNEHPYDLLAGDLDAASVQLDPVQVTLLLTRLAADGAAPGAAGGHAVPRMAFSPPFAVRRVAFVAPAAVADAATTSAHSCSLNDLQSEITDWAALGESSIFNFIWQQAAERGGRGLQSAAAATPFAGALITLAKMYLTFHAIEVDISMAPSPLERNRSMDDGKTSMLTAKVRADTGKWQNVNCVRFMLNLIGADADLPSDGKLSGVGVFWRVLDGPVMFDSRTPDQPGRIVAPDHHFTNEEGVSRIIVKGRGQISDLTRVRTRAVERSFTIGVDVQLKGRKLSEDVRDLVSSVLPHLLAGEANPLGLIADGVAETAFRSFQPAGGRELPLKDWELCDGWHGTITHTTVRSDHTRTDGRFGTFTDRTQKILTTSVTDVRGTLVDTAIQNRESIVLRTHTHGSIAIEDDMHGVEYRLRRQNEIYLCGRSNRNTSARGSGELDSGKVSIQIEPNGTYRLEFMPLAAPADGVTRGTSYSAPGCGFGFEPRSESYFKKLSSNGMQPAGWATPEVVTGTLGTDRNNISGTITRPGFAPGGKADVTITWNLSRSCTNDAPR